MCPTRGEEQLAAGGHVAGQPLLGQQPVDSRAGERLGGEQHVVIAVAGTQRVDERARPGPQIVLGHHVHGRPELAGQLERITTPDLDMPALVDARPERIDGRQSRGGGRHPGADHAMPEGSRLSR